MTYKNDIKTLEEITGDVMQAGAYVSQLDIVLSLVLGFSLKLIWSVISILQLIVFTSTIRANLPAHSTMILLELKRIALFEFIPYTWMTEPLTNFYSESP